MSHVYWLFGLRLGPLCRGEGGNVFEHVSFHEDAESGFAKADSIQPGLSWRGPSEGIDDIESWSADTSNEKGWVNTWWVLERRAVE